jgi:predicted metal-dependent peptidase
MPRLTLEQRVQRSAIEIMRHPTWQALASVLMFGKRSVSETFPTAYTNGRDVVFGRSYFESRSDPELRFVDIHEQYHKMYRHLTTWQQLFKLDPQLANMAADYVINVQIVDADGGAGFVKMPKGGLFDTQYRGLTVAEVFRKLRQNPPPGRGKGGKGGKGQPGAGEPGDPGDYDGAFDEHGWEEAEAMTEAEKAEIAREIDHAVRAGALAAGKTGSGGDRILGELLQPQIDWREAMREFVTNTMRRGSSYGTWQRLNRRYLGSGYLMPGTVNEQVGEWVVAVDTSGSIGPKPLNMFMSELTALAETVSPEKIHLLYWDTAVCQHETYEPDGYATLAQATKPAGGGGTMVECVPAFIAEKSLNPQGVLVLTDGYLGGSWGAWSCPVLWCVLDNKSARPSVGTALHIDSHRM